MALSRSADQEVAAWRLTSGRLLWLTVCIALVLAPHASRVPLWVILGYVAFAAWRFAALRRGRAPSRWLVAALTVATLPGIYLSYGTLLGRGAGVALLAILAGMKLLETRTLRDAYIVVFLGFFLVVTNFLFSQSISSGLYMFLVVLALTAAMISLCTRADALAPRSRVRLAALMLVQAVPIMLILFVLFPRISGPVWGLPKDAYSARSGLGDTMSPGQISSLGLSGEVAFRVDFRGQRPETGELYWRGPVLWTSDGVTWRTRAAGRSARAVPAERLGKPVDYQLTLEPHDQTWLFALDVPALVPPAAQMTEDYTVVARKKVRERRRYLMRSYPDYRMPHLSDEERLLALELPPGAHPRARALALQWRSGAGSAEGVVRTALAHFNREAFYYTLQPPLLRGDVVDEFLFETRRGFCEHYSAAFTVLMRAAGVPARVVTGYQGGEYNDVGDYLVVRQRDAHAWVEVWLGSSGWTRVDPTAAVSPARIRDGMDAVIPPTIGPRALGIEPSGTVERAWRWARQGLDAMSNGWNQWVLGYGPARQNELLGRLGLDPDHYLGIAAAIAGGIGLVMALVALWLARRPGGADPAARLYRRFCTVLARKGVQRHPHEGPLDFAQRVIRLHPAWARSVVPITDLYVRARYAGHPEVVKELARAVRKLRLG